MTTKISAGIAGNPAAKLRALLPPQPALMVGQVMAHNADGTSTVALPGGQQVRAQGTSVAIASQAFIRNERVEGEAPALVETVINV